MWQILKNVPNIIAIYLPNTDLTYWSLRELNLKYIETLGVSVLELFIFEKNCVTRT